ncbi:dihydroxy-acid dehydratase [Dactylosporangium sp. CA-092794]|uniref:dihydroxy-acid dehydratase n=1 Tax=Dactylosporangium sp. CA-092794 TaxID=3239929 RepID=UPI003D928575
MSQEGTARGGGELFDGPSVDAFVHRAFMRGRGLSAEQVRRRPVIGICSSWSELNPCNSGLDRVAQAVKDGVTAAGGLPLVFPTISISEPFSRPSSMLLRNLMAMDVEQMIASSPIDAVVLLGGCDKTVPAQLMGAISAGKPALVVTAGPRQVGCWRGESLTVDDLWPLADRRRQGLVSDEQWRELEDCLNPSTGTCNVMGTAITMAAIAEVLGFALPGSSLPVATGARRLALAEETGRRIVAAAGEKLRPSELVTPAALENAVRVVCAVSGSTNAVVHLAAIAGRAGIRLSRAKLRQWTRDTPVLADVRPAGRHLLAQLEQDGGIPAVVRRLGDRMHLDCRTATGRRWADELPPDEGPTPSLRTVEDPVDADGALAVLEGNLAPDGAIIKRSAASARLLRHVGPAVVFDGVDDLHARIDDPALPIGPDSVLVLRGTGPRGGPGMPEVGHLPIPRRLLDAGVDDMVRISDARMSGTATGTVVLHVAPEAAVGGPLSLVRDGDPIRLDVPAGALELLVDPAVLGAREPVLPAGVPPRRGYDLLYWRHVSQAPAGCDFDFLRGAEGPGGGDD